MAASISVGLLLTIQLATIAFYTVALKLGLQWVRAEKVTNRAAIGTSIGLISFQIAGYVLILLLTPAKPIVRETISIAHFFLAGVIIPLV